MTKHLLPIAAGLACLAATAATPAAEVVDIRWDAAGRFAHQGPVAAGKLVEVCGALPAGATVAWRFTASTALDFNIHYHEGKEVRYPERRDALASASGLLQVALDQDYCWMWTNKSGQPVRLDLQLRR